MKNILLIGLGRFGRHMAQTLSDLHHQVLVIDKNEHKVQEAMSYVTNGQNVPDDISVFHTQKIVKSILGGK